MHRKHYTFDYFIFFSDRMVYCIFIFGSWRIIMISRQRNLKDTVFNIIIYHIFSHCLSTSKVPKLFRYLHFIISSALLLLQDGNKNIKHTTIRYLPTRSGLEIFKIIIGGPMAEGATSNFDAGSFAANNFAAKFSSPDFFRSEFSPRGISASLIFSSPRICLKPGNNNF